MDLRGGSRIFVVLLFFASCNIVECLNYDVHWLEGTTTIEREAPSSMKQKVDIYCFPGISKNLLALFQTVKFHVKTKSNDEFSQYVGTNPEEVFKDYTEDSYGWSSVISPFQRRAQKSLYLDLFTPTCMAINTKQRHSIELQVIRVDIWRVLLMILGLVIIHSSKALSGNTVFFYLCGIFIGVFASFMVIVYYVSKLLPKKTLTYGILIGGWTVGVYVFQQVWENLRTIVASYQTYMFWYTTIVSFVSFLICYRIGPPRNERSKNIVMWTLQGVGMMTVFFSSDYREASAAVVLVSLAVKYFPESLLRIVRGYWLRKFPPQRRLLTNEEYYEEGARETKKALEELRKHCASPDCAQWSIMLKLHDSRRFASFVEGNSHLSDEEIMDFESYAFSMDSARKRPVANSTGNGLEISDDDEISDDEL
ncbi:nuclear envelope integral membrane protein [Ostrinia nubilalis]|uniref:nuclear envelope integral membrane protein n=1 Tax=Ostrinia nubilalis TaxID=29057 RepID=UPI00103A41E9|nr:nuclear envelope integral membrane protein 1a isoform X3 [Ostrinia furnacalis]XP_028177131.1 nuclear envelope integral membrane protein 1a isoform X4 [Ostrinia furnacalis]